MGPDEALRWKCEVLDRVFIAVARSPQLARSLVFKGARVLSLHLGEMSRQSADLDSNFDRGFIAERSDPQAQRQFLEEELRRSIRRRDTREAGRPLMCRCGSRTCGGRCAACLVSAWTWQLQRNSRQLRSSRFLSAVP